MKKFFMMAILIVPFFTFTLLTQAQAAPASGVSAASSVVAAPTIASDNTGQTNQTLYDILFTYLALSIIFEVAMHPIFNWSIFLKRFEGKGWKVPITVGVALYIFHTYNMDIIRDVLNAQSIDGSTTHSTAPGGKFLTALLIAGGSSGVLQVFRKLGIRPPVEETAAKAAKLKDEAAQAKAKAKAKANTGDAPA